MRENSTKPPQPHISEPADVAESRFISVAIPTFRRPDTIRRAIDSVLHQDFSNWELIVSDDEGPDGQTWAMLTDYARADPRIRIVENRRGRGQVENTNNVMLACRGSWIKLLHDDDWLAPKALGTFAQVAQQYPSAAFITCATNRVEDDRVKLRSARPGKKHVTVCSSQQTLKDLYLVRTTRSFGIIPSSLLVNSIVVQNGCLMRTYKSITAGVDQLFFIDLARHGDMVMIEDGLIFYDATNHSSVTASTTFDDVDRETIDLKHLTWSLIEDKHELPDPETIAGALQVARLRSRFRHQPWGSTIRHALQIFHPSVTKAVNQDIFARVQAVLRRRLRRTNW
ncbi:glycosyltransferase family 2 protein [Mesorhizobium japonicum]|uniref:Mlr9727 protein n=1 Tax=Mesorhizobium japonicum (strain LMG 29417 / CECT 9101 / MAFF 303099) TaxID=266835 RepID=Q98NV3_RHILO|nr:glycosyltransferase family 2 protein [Mesorhizobium japonicum]BAB54902.1 mlr9727 [Mesorhizobium japonicum MAFF 303099]